MDEKIYIIGGGVTASIVKMYVKNSKIIAPEGRSFLPIHYIWKTFETEKFMKKFNINFKEDILKVGSYTSNNDRDFYNKITHKPLNNKPSSGKKNISVLKCMIPEVKTDINDSVQELDMKNKLIKCKNNTYEYNKVYICSPLLFKPFNTIYYGMRIYKALNLNNNKPSWSYAYLGGNLLKNLNIYRTSQEENNIIFLEQTGYNTHDNVIIEDEYYKLTGVKIKIIESFINKYAHFDISKENTDTQTEIYSSRLSTLNNEFLLSDLIKKMSDENGI